MDNSQSQEIKHAVDIVEVVRESVPGLKPSGSNWKGICPFHNEKTPSFMVSQDKQIWHCFGCNEGGDVFSFVMKTQGLEFYDALKQLADRAGIVLKTSDPAQATLRNQAVSMHATARELYTKELFTGRGAAARDYLKKRGITKELVLELGIGLSPDAWDKLYNHLVKEGFTNKQILASGLVVQSDKGKYFDRFRSRLMFSLIDGSGQIVGMAGRTLKQDAKEAKYINSPQTVLYNKSNFLYGFHYAKQAIRADDLVVVVEGYFDWIALYKNGYKNVVAVSGTALTDSHVQQLKRYTKNIAFALDTDEAGARALERSVLLTLQYECNPFVLDYRSVGEQTFKDPDELLASDVKAWEEVITKKRLALDYYISLVSDKLTSSDVLIQKEGLSIILPFLARTKNTIDYEHFTKKIAGLSGISETAISEEVRKLAQNDDPSYAATPREAAPITTNSFSPRYERLLQWIAFVIAEPKYFEDVARELHTEDLQDEDIKNTYKQLITIYKQNKGLPDYTELVSKVSFPSVLERWFIKSEELFQGFSEEEKKEELILLTRKIKEDSLRYQLERISKKIKEAEHKENEKEISELVKEHRKITETLSHLLQH